ncbi:type II secretion system F family protein [Cellulomonas fengjieae]|uniref:type II secretion system F family protein n=1 Tax=Cellulomonas fengjieae TaxID=2819978 RepID=UPI001AAE8EFD|nr:type II secretion system F family protein [Cellulomonas fengjieae]MBO3101832.1 type II secretion system F family protein [Cellulomonas fengjieae]
MTPAALAVAVALSAALASSPWWWGGAGPRRSRPTRPVRVRVVVQEPMDTVLLLDLLDVAIATGAPLPRALAAVGSAVGGAQGEALARGGSALLLGATWQSAWAGTGVADVVGALEPAWDTGSAPGPALRGRADQLRRDRRTRTRAAAGALAVRLVLPLGLCFLPAFILLGLVPMLLSLAGDLLG